MRTLTICYFFFGWHFWLVYVGRTWSFGSFLTTACTWPSLTLCRRWLSWFVRCACSIYLDICIISDSHGRFYAYRVWTRSFPPTSLRCRLYWPDFGSDQKHDHIWLDSEFQSFARVLTLKDLPLLSRPSFQPLGSVSRAPPYFTLCQSRRTYSFWSVWDQWVHLYHALKSQLLNHFSASHDGPDVRWLYGYQGAGLWPISKHHRIHNPVFAHLGTSPAKVSFCVLDSTETNLNISFVVGNGSSIRGSGIPPRIDDILCDVLLLGSFPQCLCSTVRCYQPWTFLYSLTLSCRLRGWFDKFIAYTFTRGGASTLIQFLYFITVRTPLVLFRSC